MPTGFVHRLSMVFPVRVFVYEPNPLGDLPSNIQHPSNELDSDTVCGWIGWVKCCGGTKCLLISQADVTPTFQKVWFPILGL